MDIENEWIVVNVHTNMYIYIYIYIYVDSGKITATSGRNHSKWWFSKGFSRKCPCFRLRNYNNLARYIYIYYICIYLYIHNTHTYIHYIYIYIWFTQWINISRWTQWHSYQKNLSFPIGEKLPFNTLRRLAVQQNRGVESTESQKVEMWKKYIPED